jgi:hypothetical protein
LADHHGGLDTQVVCRFPSGSLQDLPDCPLLLPGLAYNYKNLLSETDPR